MVPIPRVTPSRTWSLTHNQRQRRRLPAHQAYCHPPVLRVSRATGRPPGQEMVRFNMLPGVAVQVVQGQAEAAEPKVKLKLPLSRNQAPDRT